MARAGATAEPDHRAGGLEPGKFAGLFYAAIAGIKAGHRSLHLRPVTDYCLAELHGKGSFTTQDEQNTSWL